MPEEYSAVKKSKVMNIKKLEKAYKVIERIKILDNDIIQIEKVAMSTANNTASSSFKLFVKNIGETDNKENILEEDGSLKKGSLEFGVSPFSLWGSMFSFPRMGSEGKETKDKKDTTVLGYELSETATLKILAILLLEKQQLREELLKELEKFGLKI